MGRLTALAALLFLAGCSDPAPEQTIEGVSPDQDATLQPGAAVTPEAGLAPNTQIAPQGTLEPGATLQPDTTLVP